MKVALIALIAHSINAAYCRSLGDNTQTDWANAPEWQKQSAIAGVEMHIANPGATPEQSHESWYKQKELEGWAFGEIKDPDKKLHPCFVPYDQLPPEQKAKDYLFREVVHSLKDLPDPDDYEALVQEVAKLQKNVIEVGLSKKASPIASGITIKYGGNKSLFKDHIYGTGLTFVPGQCRTLPGDIAAKFLAHPEFKREHHDEGHQVDAEEPETEDDTADILKRANQAKTLENEVEARVQDEIDTVNRIEDKDSLVEYAMNKYQQKLNKTFSVANLREKVVEMIRQYGIV